MFSFASKFRKLHCVSLMFPILLFPFARKQIIHESKHTRKHTRGHAFRHPFGHACRHAHTQTQMHTHTKAHEGTLAGTNVGTHFGMYLGMHQGNKRRCTYRHTYRVIDADAYADTLLGTHASILADADKDAGRLTTARVNRYATATNSATRLFLEFYGDSLLLTF